MSELAATCTEADYIIVDNIKRNMLRKLQTAFRALSQLQEVNDHTQDLLAVGSPNTGELMDHLNIDELLERVETAGVDLYTSTMPLPQDLEFEGDEPTDEQREAYSAWQDRLRMHWLYE